MRALLFLLLTSCSFFIPNNAPKTAKGDEYKVTFKSRSWKLVPDRRSDYVYQNINDGRILLSNSFCNEFQDQPLEQLAERTFRTVGTFTSRNGEHTTFSEREAYRLEGQGHVDGVPVDLKLLNTRRNNCYIDFVAITPTNTAPLKEDDFEAFLKSVTFK